MRRLAIIVSVMLVVGWIGLLVSGTRVLVSEDRVGPGQHYIVDGYGDLAGSQQASLVCRYFTGQSVLARVFWYSPNGFLGRDSCPFLLRD